MLRPRLTVLALGLALLGCDTRLQPDQFQKRAEQLFVEVNPGFSVYRRRGLVSTMVRGDQLYELDLGAKVAEYKAGGASTSDYFAAFEAILRAEAEARRRPLTMAKDLVIPVLKGGAWIRAQDLGAIGPPRMQDKLRPWRKGVADDLFVVLGIREDLLGVRYVSIDELTDSKEDADALLARAIKNLVGQVKTSTGVELRSAEGRLLVLDLPNVDGVSGLVLDPAFRRAQLSAFGLDEIGAAIPNRDVLILFDPTDFVATKPVRARTHQLYDARNHPGFRGLLKLSADAVSVLEGGAPKPGP